MGSRWVCTHSAPRKSTDTATWCGNACLAHLHMESHRWVIHSQTHTHTINIHERTCRISVSGEQQNVQLAALKICLNIVFEIQLNVSTVINLLPANSPTRWHLIYKASVLGNYCKAYFAAVPWKSIRPAKSFVQLLLCSNDPFAVINWWQ